MSTPPTAYPATFQPMAVPTANVKAPQQTLMFVAGIAILVFCLYQLITWVMSVVSFMNILSVTNITIFQLPWGALVFSFIAILLCIGLGIVALIGSRKPKMAKLLIVAEGVVGVVYIIRIIQVIMNLSYLMKYGYSNIGVVFVSYILPIIVYILIVICCILILVCALQNAKKSTMTQA